MNENHSHGELKYTHRYLAKAVFCLLAFTFLALLPVAALADEVASESYPATVQDISDRAYERAVIDLLDSAKESIVMSMYIVNVRETGPVRLLVRDLEEALERGVTVEMYLNSRVDRGAPAYDDVEKPLQCLVEKGARLYRFSPSFRLHDKLIIVDSRYVVEGSTNWSVSAIKSNYESAVLIDSPGLARAKLLRLRRFPLADEAGALLKNSRPDRPQGLAPLPAGTVVPLPAALLLDKRYFRQMIRRQAKRDMDAYLLLSAESVRLGEKAFFVPLEEMAVSLGMDPACTDTALRRQMIKELRILHNRYKLLDVDFSYGRDAWVELKDLGGPTFPVRGELCTAPELAGRSHPATYMLLIQALLESEGSSLDAVPVSELAKRFGISVFSIRKGMK